MPNWVSNELTVRLPADQVEKFKAAVGGKMYEDESDHVLCAHKIIPYPQEFYDRDKEMHHLAEKAKQEHGLEGSRCIYECPTHGLVSTHNTHELVMAGKVIRYCNACKQAGTDTVVTWAKDGFNSGGYEWCIANWGTKWGFCEPELISEGVGQGKEMGSTTLHYTFNTAWSPASKLIAALAKQWPLAVITIEFKEETGWSGSEEYRNGKLYEETFKPEDDEPDDDEDIEAEKEEMEATT